MTATVVRIRKWTETYERAESRKLKVLTWIAMPVAFNSSGYNAMLDEFGDDAPAIYGAWCALCGFAASCHVRGCLGDGRGNPLTIRHIARVTGFPPAIYERLFDWATRPEVGWLEPAEHAQVMEQLSQNLENRRESTSSGESPDDPPAARGNPPSTRHDTTEHDRTGQDKTEPNIVRRTDVWASASKEFWERVVEIANAMDAMQRRGKLVGIDRETIWRMAWVANDFDRVGFLDALARVREGSIKKPSGYLGSTMVKICQRHGHDWDQVKLVVPPPVARDPVKQPPSTTNQQPPTDHHGGTDHGQETRVVATA